MLETTVKKTFDTVCQKCDEQYQREVVIDDKELLNDLTLTDQEKAKMSSSNTEVVFCDKCTEEFIEWMREKGYLKTDCWCSHIEEYKKEAEK